MSGYIGFEPSHSATLGIGELTLEGKRICWIHINAEHICISPQTPELTDCPRRNSVAVNKEPFGSCSPTSHRVARIFLCEHLVIAAGRP